MKHACYKRWHCLICGITDWNRCERQEWPERENIKTKRLWLSNTTLFLPHLNKTAITSFLDGRRPQVCFILQLSQVQRQGSGKRERQNPHGLNGSQMSLLAEKLHKMNISPNPFRNSHKATQIQWPAFYPSHYLWRIAKTVFPVRGPDGVLCGSILGAFLHNGSLALNIKVFG